MDTRTGIIYPNKQEALEAGVPENRLVTGSIESLEYLQTKLKKTKTKNQLKAERRKAKGK